MSVNRWAAKRDANEPAIVKALQAVGVEVWKISGKDKPDLLTRYRGRWLPLGVKMPKGALTAGEHQGVKWPLVRTVDDAFEAVGIALHICRQPGFDAALHRCLGCQP